MVCTYAFHAFTDYCLQSLQNLSSFKQHFIALELADFQGNVDEVNVDLNILPSNFISYSLVLAL